MILEMYDVTIRHCFLKSIEAKIGKSRFFAMKSGFPVFLKISETDKVSKKWLRFSWSAQNFDQRTMWNPWGMICLKIFFTTIQQIYTNEFGLLSFTHRYLLTAISILVTNHAYKMSHVSRTKILCWFRKC